MVAVVALALAVAGCWLIIAGLPDRTPTQRTMLELSSLPLSLAVVVVIGSIVRRRGLLRPPYPRLAIAGLVLVGLGLLDWIVVALGVRLPVLNPLGAQALTWLGVGCWCIWVLLTPSPGRSTRWTTLDEE